LIENATFQVTAWLPAIPPVLGAVVSRYDIDAVDWFLGQFKVQERRAASADTAADPWRDLPVTQIWRSANSPPGKPSLKQLLGLDQILEWDPDFSRNCERAWRDFDRQPGVILRQGERVRFWARRYVLHTGDRKTIASHDAGRNFYHVGERRFTYRIRSRESWPPGVTEIAVRSARDFAGHFSEQAMTGTVQAPVVYELVDEAGEPVLFISGENYGCRACACITFADKRWFRFLIRGTQQNAIMTAVDEAGNKIARYRHVPDNLRYSSWDYLAITVHPGQELTDELLLAIMISTQWLDSYFT
jgi:hypothetical protein